MNKSLKTIFENVGEADRLLILRTLTEALKNISEVERNQGKSELATKTREWIEHRIELVLSINIYV